MNLRIDSFSASFSYDNEVLQTLVARLENEGYRPLIRKLGQNLCEFVGRNNEELFQSKPASAEESELQSEANRRKLLGLEQLGYKWGIDGLRSIIRVPELEGELFLAEHADCLLFLSLLDLSAGGCGRKTEDIISEEISDKKRPGLLRVGLIGASPRPDLLELFMSEITSILAERGESRLKWTADNLENMQFNAFRLVEENSVDCTLAAQIGERELRSSRALENAGAREVACVLTRSGVMLAKELLRLKPEAASDTVKYIDQLIQAELLRQEYVVICSKSGAHVNRVEKSETIEQMAKWGVHCSCGKPVSEEPIEGLLASDNLLHRLMDKNYWMSVSVVRALLSLGIPADRILLNHSALTDSVEILADLEGTLLLFGLKDAEFDISHAISLGARISVHKPNLAFLVSTKGISAEVKEHFKRTRQETQIIYIPNILQLDASLKKVVEGVRTARARCWLDSFQSMINFALSDLLLGRLESGKSERAKPLSAVSNALPRVTDSIIRSPDGKRTGPSGNSLSVNKAAEDGIEYGSISVAPSQAMHLFSDAANRGDEAANFEPQLNQYTDAQKPAEAYAESSSITIKESAEPAQTARPLTAMDILDNVLEAVSAPDQVAAAVPGNAAAQAQPTREKKEDEVPLATF